MEKIVLGDGGPRRAEDSVELLNGDGVGAGSGFSGGFGFRDLNLENALPL